MKGTNQMRAYKGRCYGSYNMAALVSTYRSIDVSRNLIIWNASLVMPVLTIFICLISLIFIGFTSCTMPPAQKTCRICGGSAGSLRFIYSEAKRASSNLDPFRCKFYVLPLWDQNILEARSFPSNQISRRTFVTVFSIGLHRFSAVNPPLRHGFF